jgi:signal transduction histidine kinase
MPPNTTGLMKQLFIILLMAVLLFQPSQKSRAQSLPETFPDSLEKYSGRDLATVLADLSWRYREKDTEMAAEYALKGIEISEANEYKEQLARLYNYLGVIYQHYKHQTQTAIPYYNKGLKMSLEVKDSVEIAYVYNNLGDAFYEIGNKVLAEQYAEKSMQTFLKLKNPRGIAYSCINLGVINRKNGNYDTAFYYFKKAIAIRQDLNDSIGIASATLELAWTYSDMQHCDSSMHYFKKSLHLHQALKNKNYIAYSQIGMGKCYLNNHEYDSALFYYQQALSQLIDRGNNSGIISSYLGLGMAYKYKKLFALAEDAYDNALLYAGKHGSTDELLNVYNDRADFFYEIQDYSQANRNYKQYIHVFDSLFTEMQFQTLAEVENRFTITEELNRANESLRQKKQRYLFSIIIIGLLLLLIFALYLRQRIKDKLTAELQESIQTKNKIFHIISHDLISPFNILLGFSQVLQDKLHEKEYDQAESYANTIFKTADETLELTKNLLNWAQAQRNKIEVSKEHFIIADLIEESRSSFQHIANKKDISISVECSLSKKVYADKDLIRTTLNNLINNAIKFSRSNSDILIGCHEKGEMIEVFVQDSGVGISSEKQALIFRESATVSTPGTNNEKGTGLGLLVSKEFVELNGGTISVVSEEGKGSTFAFTIPVNQ